MKRAPFSGTSAVLGIMLASHLLLAEDAVKPLIEWRSPPECRSVQDVEERVRSILGHTVQSDASRRFIGSITSINGKWVTTVEVSSDDKSFSRSVTVNTCETATEISALLVALVLEPTQVLGSDDPALQDGIETLNNAAAPEDKAHEEMSETEPDKIAVPGNPENRANPGNDTAPPPAWTATEKPTSDTVTPASSSSSSFYALSYFQVGMSFVADVGSVSVFAPGLSVLGDFRLKLFAMELSVRYLPPRDSDIPARATASWSIQLLSTSLGAGMGFRIQRIRLVPLLGIAGNRMFAASKGIEQPRNASRWMSSAWLGVTVEWMMADWLGLRFQPSIHYPFTRPRFVIEGIGLVHQPSPVAGVFTIGFFFAF